MTTIAGPVPHGGGSVLTKKPVLTVLLVSNALARVVAALREGKVR